jgi:hypothetical protein
MSSQGMVANQQAAMAGVGDVGASNQAAMMAKMKGMGGGNPADMMKMLQGGLGQAGQEMGAKAQQNVQNNPQAGTGQKEDMVSTIELKILNTNPIPDAAFEVPAGAQKI